MGTETQDAAAARAREARAAKMSLLHDLTGHTERLLKSWAVRRAGGGGIFDDRCRSCHDTNRHTKGHACKCPCHDVRRTLDAIHGNAGS
jgi:hypothetical protein